MLTTRSIRIAWTHHRAPLQFIGALCLASSLLAGCHKAPPAAADAAAPASGAGAKPESAAKTGAGSKDEGGDKAEAGAKDEAGAKEEAGAGVTLTPEQIEKLGVATETVQSTDYTEETAGYGVVVAHEAIAQAAAELVTAQATARLSQSALARAKRLSGTPGAVSADVEETAANKAEVDAAALTLTMQRMSSTLGMNPPWKAGENSPILQELAGGRTKLVRVTFPLGALSGGIPSSLRAAHIGGSKPDKSWKINKVWDAPADANVPGRSFFALLKGSDAGEGERLLVWAPIGESEAGVVVPATAAVMSDGKYWCYVEKKPGNFVKSEIDTAKPVPDGYFLTEGVAAGDKVVTTAAGQLLARESNSGSEAE
jgi:hypothetical protein